jgi:hypothetical protein
VDVATSVIETAAGKPAPSGDGEQAILAFLYNPAGIAVDSGGNLYIADQANGRIRRVGPDGIMRTIAGADTPLARPRHLAVDSRGAVYFSEGDSVRRLETSGAITTVIAPNTSGVGPLGCLLITPTDEVVICNGNRIQRRLPNGQFQAIAGTDRPGFAGDGGAAVSALLSTSAQSAVYDRLGNLYFVDAGNLRIRRVAPNGLISTVAGTGRRGSTPDGRLAAESDLDAPSAVTVDAEGNLYVAEINRIRKISPTGVIVTLAGDTNYGFDGEGSLGVNARFDGIEAMVADAAGNLYVSDTLNNRVRKLTPLD